MVDIYVQTQSGFDEKWETIDLFQDESIIIKDKVADSADVSKLFSAYTQEFRVPASQNNNRIFKGIFKKGRTDVLRYMYCKIYNNGQLFRIGRIYFGESTMNFGKLIDYKINFSSLLGGIKERLGESLINSLDIPDINYDTYMLSWTVPTINTSVRNGVTPLSSTNRRFVANDNLTEVVGAPPGTFIRDKNNIKWFAGATILADQSLIADELRPSINGKIIFDKILYNLGYDVEYDEITDDINGVFNQFRIMCTADEYVSEPMIVNGWNDVTDPIITGSDWWLEKASDDSFYLKHSNLSTTQKKIISYRTFVRNTFDGCLPMSMKVEWFDYYTGEKFASSSILATERGIDEQFEIIHSLSVDIATFPEPVHRIKLIITPNFYQRTIVASPTDRQAYIQEVKLHSGNLYPGTPGVTQGIDCNFQNAGVLKFIRLSPKIKQVDFIQNVIRMFNMFIYVDKDVRVTDLTRTKIRITTLNKPSDSANVVDFSPYIFHDNNTVNQQEQYGIYSFGYGLSKTDTATAWVSANMENSNSKEYGQLLFNNETTLSTNKYDIKPTFTVPPQETIDGTNIPTFSMIQDGDKFVANEPIIFIRCYGTSPEIPLLSANGDVIYFNIRENYGAFSSGGYVFDSYRPTTMNTDPFLVGGIMTPPKAITFKDEVNLMPQFIVSHTLFSEFYKYTIQKITQPERYVYKFKGKLPPSLVISYNITNQVIIGDSLFDIIESDIDITTGIAEFTCVNSAPIIL